MSWQTVPLRQLITPNNKRNRPDLPLLSVVRDKGIIKRKLDKSDNHNIIPEDLSNYKVVSEGQFVINKMKAWQGSCGVSQYEGIVSPAYYVFDLNIGNPRFFNYAIRSRIFVDEFGRISSGIRVDQWDLSLQKLKYVPFLLPPREEQDQIVRYLDWKVSQINKLINAKRRQIALLVEQKRAVINEALTQNGDGWNVARLKHLCHNIGDIDHKMPEAQGDGIPYISPRDFYSDNAINFNNAKKISQKSFEELSKKIRPEKGDLIFSRYATLGATRLVDTDIDFLVSYSCVTIKPNQLKINTEYLYFYFISSLIENEIRNYSYETTQSNIGVDSIKKFRISYPSDITTQQTIVDFVKSKTSTISKTLDAMYKEITLFAEYRTRLISDVVTGKLDVRGVSVPEYDVVGEIVGDETIDDSELTEVEELQ